MRDKLRKLEKNCLKPQQKICLLRNYFIPRYVYRIKYQHIISGMLRTIDKDIRLSISSFLHLPRDTPIPMFHEPTSVGGLGVPEIETPIIE